MTLSSQQEIQVLHVDDEPDFADLTTTFLERENDRFTVKTATSADEGLEILADRPPDCVVSDYNMPGMDGIEFLQAAREEYPDLPFILFTGKGSEAVASEAIAAKVTDYLQKGSGSEQYELLANRIRNAVQSRRETERADRQEELMRLTEFAGDTGGFELDRESDTLLLTAGTRRIIGRPDQNEIPLEEAVKLFHADDHGDIQETLAKAFETGEELHRTWRLQPDNGDQRLLEMKITPIVENGEVTKLRGVGHDTTDRKERQEELQRTRELITNMEGLADAGAWEYESETEQLTLTDGVRRLYGRDTDEDLTLGEAFDAIHPDDRDQLRDRFDACLETGEPYEIEIRLTTPDGGQRWLSARGERVTADENANVVRGYIQDITEQRSREQSLERYQTALNELPDPVVVYDEDGQYDIVNQAAAEVRDAPREELTGTKSRYLEQIREETSAEYNALLEGKRDSLRVELTANFSGPGTQTFECRFSRITETADPNGVVMTTRDVTARNERERKLKREREKYATLFETLPNPVLHARAKDGEPIVETVNPAFEDTFGYDTEAIRNEPIQEYILPDDQDDAAYQLNRQVLQDGEVQTEVRRETTDGVRTFRLNVRTRDADGESGEGYAVYTDITEQKQLERALREERDLVAGIVETVPVGLAVVDPDGSISFVNDRMEAIGGRSPKELEDISHDDSRYDLVDEHGDPLESGDTPFNRVASRETAIHDQVMGFRRPSGERVWVSVSGAPQYNDSDELERAVFAFKDITEQRELQAELSEVLGRVSDAFYALDDEFRFTHLNSRAEELLQASEDELLGETVWDMCPMAAETDKIWDAFHAAMETQDPQDLELYYEPLDFWLETTVYPSESGISVYFRDVTEQKEYERELEAQNERLEEFTSVVSHDLRSPLTVAEGRLELAQESCENPHLAQAADAIDRSQALIEDLLTLAREGDDSSEVESVGLVDVAESSWQTVESGSATLETHATQPIQAGRSRLKQLFENFYRNAIEHSGDDVTVSVGTIDDGFYVADTGPGIPESKREDVFEAGYSTNQEGTGFGLRIVEQVADAHGWKVAVTESEQGGARFDITGVEFADK